MREDIVETIIYEPQSYILRDLQNEFNKTAKDVKNTKRSSSFRETVQHMSEEIRNMARRTKSLENIFHPLGLSPSPARRETMPVTLRVKEESTDEINKKNTWSFRESVFKKSPLAKCNSLDSTEKKAVKTPLIQIIDWEGTGNSCTTDRIVCENTFQKEIR